VRQPDLKTYLDALRSDSATVGKNAYINALRSSDAAVGEILGYLRDQDLLHSTLVVILSDHGEAFGEHGLKIHGNSIYEEEVHIPLLLINQHISRFSTVETLGGIIDVGPTIEHLLSLKPDYMLDGRSLFDPNRSDKVFLFAPSLEMVVGYRTGQTKYMYNAVRNRAEVYNLANDPAERRNISDPSSASAIRAQIPWIKSARDKPF